MEYPCRLPESLVYEYQVRRSDEEVLLINQCLPVAAAAV